MAKNMDTATDGKVVDKFKNYKKDKQVTVPISFQARPNSTPVKLAYITDDEAGILKALKPGVPHDGPMHIPNYNDYDPDRGFTSGAAMSAAESGKHTSDTLASNLSNQDIKDIRSGAIAAGAGQTVNPGFFGPKNRVSKEELRAAKEFAPAAYRATRGSRFGLGSLLGGLLGFVNPILGLAYRGITSVPETFKTFKESSSLADFYNTMKSKREDEDDMSKYNQLGLYTDRLENPDYYNDLSNEFALGAISDPYRMSVGTTQGNTLNSPFNINNINNQKGIVATDAFTGQLGDPNFGVIDENNPYGEGAG
tara:strand:+ start:138 stop:1064 length:927 start_codon:yes stop_codon:yes gene_type:complete